MSRRPRSDRGHLLVDALVAAAVLLIGLASVLGAAASHQHDLAAAGADQHAWQLLHERYELQRAAPLTSADWAVTAVAGPRTGTYAVAGEPDWTWTVAVSQVTDANLSGPYQPLSYRLAVVSLTYRGRTISLEATKW